MMVPDNWKRLSAEEIKNYKEGVCHQGNLYIQGNTDGELWKCSYCDSGDILYKGSVWIAGGVGSFFYLACEKCSGVQERIDKQKKTKCHICSKRARYICTNCGERICKECIVFAGFIEPAGMCKECEESFDWDSYLNEPQMARN